jgi:flagellar biosynthesis protein FliR
MSIELMSAWLMIFLRATGVVALFPTLAGRALPITVRLALAAGLATLLAGLVPSRPVFGVADGSLIAAAAREVTLGLLLGWSGRLVFGAVEMAGRVIANEIGLSAMPGVDAPQPAQEPVAALLTTFAGVLFFAAGAHHGVLAAFGRTFDFAPAGAGWFGPDAATLLISGTAHVLELGLRIAAPFIALNFMVNLAFSILGRAVPKMNIFIVSLSLRLILGLLLLSSAGALIARHVWPELGELPLRMLELVAP